MFVGGNGILNPSTVGGYEMLARIKVNVGVRVR